MDQPACGQPAQTARPPRPPSKGCAISTPDLPSDLHPLLARLVAETGASVLDAEAFDAWAARPGPAMALFAEDADRYKEALDLAAIVPELHATAGMRFRVALLRPAAAHVLAARYGFERWPAFVILRDGHYLGAVNAFRDRGAYVGELQRLLNAAAGTSSRADAGQGR